MVLQFVHTAAAATVPPKCSPHVLVGAFVLVAIYAYAQGRSTTRERDLHARVVLLTVSTCSGSNRCGARLGNHEDWNIEYSLKGEAEAFLGVPRM
ncbi:hypothetical protein C8Q80DRAFT_1151516 [Daedaleopsis nitida]|nr:hypothetical protein C8Q80DRAFT_1151516 [Daedaleopsis nitida]